MKDVQLKLNDEHLTKLASLKPSYIPRQRTYKIWRKKVRISWTNEQRKRIVMNIRNIADKLLRV